MVNIFEIFTQQGFRIFGDELKKIKVPKYFTLGSGTGGIKTAFILEDQKFYFIHPIILVVSQ